MDREEVIKRFCKLQTKVNALLFNHEHAADCFCADMESNETIRRTGYQNEGKALEFIEMVVDKALER